MMLLNSVLFHSNPISLCCTLNYLRLKWSTDSQVEQFMNVRLDQVT